MHAVRHFSNRIGRLAKIRVPVLHVRDFHFQACYRCSDRSSTTITNIPGSELQSRNFSKVTDNTATELYFEEIFDHGFSGEDPLFDLRNYFYPESDDPSIVQLSNAGCVLEVLDHVTNMTDPQHSHITQAVATLHHLFKLSGFVGQADHYWDYRNNAQEFNSQLRENELFGQLCQLIHEKIPAFNNNELAFMYMAMRKFGISSSDHLLRDIYLTLSDNFKTLDIETLSYLSVGLRSRFHTDLNRPVWRLGLIKAIPRMQELLRDCRTPEELRKIVICFYNLAFLISDKMMDQLVEKVEIFIRSGDLAKPANLQLLNKLLALVLAKGDWHEEHGKFVMMKTEVEQEDIIEIFLGKYVNSLLSQYKGLTKYLRPVNAVMLCKVLKSYGEPVSVFYDVYHRLCEILQNKDFVGHMPMINVLSAVVSVNPSAVPIKDIEDILETLIASHHLVDHVEDVFSIMRNVGIIKNELVDKFFMSSFDALKKEDSNGNEIVKFASRYMMMHSVFTGLYLNDKFEKNVVNFILQEMEEKNPIILHPKALAARISILICFGEMLKPEHYQKFQDFLPQYSAQSLLFISKAIDFQLKKLTKFFFSANPGTREQRSPFYNMLEDMSLMINKASENKLKAFDEEGSDDKLVDIADLMRNYIYRNDFFNEYFNFVKGKLMERINEGEVSTKTVGLICTAVSNPRQKIETPELLRCLVRFYMSRPDPTELHTMSVYRLLEICFDSGHVPDREFLHLFCQLLTRDIDSISGLRTITIAFILCYYNAVSQPLVKAIFSNEFMSRLDNEMKLASDRKHYPKMLRKGLMSLNRAVVLRYPQYGVPWFHSRYCAENEIHLRLKRSVESRATKEEVADCLSGVLGGWRYFQENTFSQYYNTIDFEIHLNEKGQPVDLSTDRKGGGEVVKVAILVMPPHMFTVDTRSLAGYLHANAEELKLQNWKVIQLNPYTWHSMHMGEKNSKKEYLKQQLALAVL